MISKNGIEQDLVDKFVQVAHTDLDAVKSMLEAEPSLLNSRSSIDGEMAIQAASHMGRRKIAEYLLEMGAPPNICTASLLADARTVREMLAQDRKLAHAGDAHGNPLAYFVALGGSLEIAEEVLSHGADFNLGGGSNTALHAAAFANRAEMAEWLLKHGANPDLTNFEGKTPLQVAVAQKRTEVEGAIRRITSGD